MKQFNVYGIGNALVDIDFEVSVQTLERLNIKKGLMTLIDEATHYRLLEELDGIKHLKACGGSAANTLFTLQQLGAKTFYSCKVGQDEAGDFFYKDLILQGIQTNLSEAPCTGITGKCIVLVTPDADRTMNTFLGTTSEFSKAQLSDHALKNSDYLYIEGYLVAAPKAYEAALYAKNEATRLGVKIAMTLSDPNMVTYFKNELLTILDQKIKILFCNEAEALLFTNCSSIKHAREALKQYAETFVITMGAEGALIYDGNAYFQIPGNKVDVVDTVGAGDVFAGAFLYAITHEYNYKQAGIIASYAASKVVAKFGPRLNQDEIKEVQNYIDQQLSIQSEPAF